MILIGLLFRHVQVKPYKHEKLNHLETLATSCAILLTTYGMYESGLGEGKEQNIMGVVLSVGAMVMACILFITAVVYFV